jgi:hypothetical protein
MVLSHEGPLAEMYSSAATQKDHGGFSGGLSRGSGSKRMSLGISKDRKADGAWLHRRSAVPWPFRVGGKHVCWGK